MPYIVKIADAQAEYPDYVFIKALTPSEQKAAFHVQDKDGKDLCLKIIAPNSSVERVEREIKALQAITHPNVVRLVEYTFSSRVGAQRHFMIEEFVEGQDLSSLYKGRAWSEKNALRVFGQLAEGLSALGKMRIVHRDLKPSNIRIRTDGSVVIIDFGLARHLDLPDLTKTSDGARIGTPLYFAPEQWRGTKKDIDHRTDLFALGVLLFEAMTGEHPFHVPGMGRNEYIDAVCESNALFSKPAFVALDSRWQTLLRVLLAKERSGRPHSAEHVSIILTKLGAKI